MIVIARIPHDEFPTNVEARKVDERTDQQLVKSKLASIDTIPFLSLSFSFIVFEAKVAAPGNSLPKAIHIACWNPPSKVCETKRTKEDVSSPINFLLLKLCLH